jgi:hypothetical protein
MIGRDAIRMTEHTALFSCLLMASSGCAHKLANSVPSPPPSAGATLKVELAWIANSQDDLSVTRTVVLTGKQLSAAPDSRFVSCFRSDKRIANCQFLGQFNPSIANASEPEFDGTENIANAQLGVWVVTATGEFSGGEVAEQNCAVDVDSSRVFTLKITLGVGPSCVVQ